MSNNKQNENNNAKHQFSNTEPLTHAQRVAIANTMSSMKLYTEFEVRNILEKVFFTNIEFKNIDEVLELLTPIELPSDSLCINCDESKSTHNVCMDCIIKIGKENIELPSDEEIDEESPYVPNDASLDFWAHKEGFVDGAKWMRDKIQGGNNEQQQTR